MKENKVFNKGNAYHSPSLFTGARNPSSSTYAKLLNNSPFGKKSSKSVGKNNNNLKGHSVYYILCQVLQ